MGNMMARIKDFVIQHSLPCMIVGSVIITLVFTIVSVTVYINSGAINVDCSLPTDAEVCAKVVADDVNEKTLSPTGAFDIGTAYDFNMIFDDIKKEMSQLGDFNATAMSDEALGL